MVYIHRRRVCKLVSKALIKMTNNGYIPLDQSERRPSLRMPSLEMERVEAEVCEARPKLFEEGGPSLYQTNTLFTPVVTLHSNRSSGQPDIVLSPVPFLPHVSTSTKTGYLAVPSRVRRSRVNSVDSTPVPDPSRPQLPLVVNHPIDVPRPILPMDLEPVYPKEILAQEKSVVPEPEYEIKQSAKEFVAREWMKLEVPRMKLLSRISMLAAKAKEVLEKEDDWESETSYTKHEVRFEPSFEPNYQVFVIGDDS